MRASVEAVSPLDQPLPCAASCTRACCYGGRRVGMGPDAGTCAGGGTRTRTELVLSKLSLPLDYAGTFKDRQWAHCGTARFQRD